MCSQAVLASIFDQFDTDGDGVVSEADLNRYIYKLIGPKSAGLTEELSNREELVLGTATDSAMDAEDNEINLDTVRSEKPVESALKAARNQEAVDSTTLLKLRNTES